MIITLNSSTLLPTSNYYTKEEVQQLITNNSGAKLLSAASKQAAIDLLTNIANNIDGTWVRVEADESQSTSTPYPKVMYQIKNSQLEFQYYIPI